MKHLFKYAFLFLGLMLMTFGCQKDNFEEQEANNLHEEGINNNLFKKGKLSDYSHVKDYIKSIKNTKHTTDVAFRSAFETSNNFVILEHQDIAIHSGDEFNTYTIPVIKLQQPEGTFSNLVVQFSVASDSTSAYLLTYDPVPGYLEDYALDDRTAFSGELTYESLDYDNSLDGLNARQFCQNVHISYCNWEHGGGHGSTHLATHNCTPGYTWVETYQICDYSSGNSGGFETIEPPSGPRGGGSGGTTNGVNTGSSTSTLPANVVNEIVSILNLNELNNQAEINWLNDYANFSEVISLFLYLDANKNSIGAYEQEALDFVEEALEALINDGEVNFENKVIIEESIPDCVKNIINELVEDDTFLDLGDMPNFVKEQLNLSGFILDLFNNSNNWQLTFKAENLPPNSNGDRTNANTAGQVDSGNPGNYIINITIDSSYIENATDLSIARTIIHETLHAYILYIYQTEIFGDLAQAYTHLLSEAGYPEDTNPVQHQLFAEEFVHAISTSLEAWDDSSLSDNNYYDYLSWSGGMMLTDVFSNLTQSFQQNAINANLAEGNAGANGGYDPLLAKGDKNCN